MITIEEEEKRKSPKPIELNGKPKNGHGISREATAAESLLINNRKAHWPKEGTKGTKGL